ncbi:glutathione hydrolase 7 [Labrus bergylta]|uniref:glutathione hydrolase 7 n=1 Tax=Labrus bergylta TaxID=56723 RepID=UPI003313A80A
MKRLSVLRQNTGKMDNTLKSKLTQQIKNSYKSVAASSHLNKSPSTTDFTCDLSQNNNVSNLPKEVHLKQLVSGSQEYPDQSLSNLKETNEASSSKASLVPVYAAFITFAFGVTIALILHINLRQILVSIKGVLVSDHELCTALGLKVLHDHGSSVDAAIAAALCLSVVHPHVSGVGGGGVMLVHDIQKNKTRVINYQDTAPETLKEEMLLYFPKLNTGLQVGVPGMLRGLHHAHSLYGRLPWKDVVYRAASVAKEGFNVSLSLSEAIEKVKGETLSKRFRDIFFPDGQALHSGLILRMPGLAGVLQAPLSNFYNGNFSQEIEDEVRANGGVLSREDISNYSVLVERPVEGLLNDSIILIPPGAALMSDLNLLVGYHLNENNNTKSQTQLAGQVAVIGPDDLMVSVVSSLCKPFGSKIITQSGIILNSAILDFSWPNKTRGQPLTNQKNRVQPEKRPLLSPMPTLVVPAGSKCGVYMAFSSSIGQQSLNMAMSRALSFHKETNESIYTRRRHPKLRSDGVLVDSLTAVFPEESAQVFQEQGQKAHSDVQGVIRKEDVITAITLPQLYNNLL